MKRIFFFISIAVLASSIVCAQSSPLLTREKTIELYHTLYLASQIDSAGWIESVKKCDSGKLMEDIYLKAEKRINFFRTVSGLDKVKLSSKFNTEAQDAAYLIKVNNQLSHAPPVNWKCYSQSAANGCSKSCLAFIDFENFPEGSFITGFVDDFGDENYAVGHRKWILYSKLKEFGYGATNSTEVVHVVDGISQTPALLPEFIAYPWSGFVPVDLIFSKWSFSIPENRKVDFSNAVITMTDSFGRKIDLEKLKERKNFLDHTIVWTAKGLFTEYDIAHGINRLEENGFLNKPIKVNIRGVKVDGKSRNYEYSVLPIKP